MSAALPTTADRTATLETRLSHFPAQRIATAPQRAIGYREAGAARVGTLPLVLLHGIGSGAASWVQQFEALGTARRVLAWDAPGYGESTCVASPSPQAHEYASALNEWLDALGIERCVVVGHSLGAIIAGSFAAARAQRIAGLLLISPAAGYAAAPEDVRTSKRDSRLAMLAELGPQGLADKRSANMLSPHADEASREWVRWNMSRIVPQGYAQATHLLANADLASDVAKYTGRVAVAVGAEDAITPPSSCERIAQAARTRLQVIPRAGHAGYIEASAAYSALIDAFCRASDGQWSKA
ncbi:Alpha/beta hydrolase fold protein [Paraburkholderia piptadeniae]|uniref:Alpha/beta hydrolase fold protein n=1 Tax=Paraburkholderia piptadeniae TaxID=1701573 RepID=A0A1N7SCN8_9BURK|nr:alpha/beta fold hydrolase [Paraburkholderia piptadeniae]SIT45140.1 Alpha/beta hydrolase fold protein [Paraburkholderia piptadeniae]